MIDDPRVLPEPWGSAIPEGMAVHIQPGELWEPLVGEGTDGPLCANRVCSAPFCCGSGVLRVPGPEKPWKSSFLQEMNYRDVFPNACGLTVCAVASLNLLIPSLVLW